LITKRDLIVTLQNRLSGGDCPDDIKGKYHPQALERVCDMVFSELVSNDMNLAKDLAIPYTLTPTEVNGEWQAPIPIPLAINAKSIILVYGCDPSDWYNVQDSILGHSIMTVLKPYSGRVSLYPLGEVFKFTRKPNATVTAFLIPNISAMNDDDMVVLTGKESTFFMAVFQAIRMMDGRPMEVVNNQKPDVDG
jgi:hypothetical protein